jgi:hypothetical protein
MDKGVGPLDLDQWVCALLITGLLMKMNQMVNPLISLEEVRWFYVDNQMGRGSWLLKTLGEQINQYSCRSPTFCPFICRFSRTIVNFAKSPITVPFTTPHRFPSSLSWLIGYAPCVLPDTRFIVPGLDGPKGKDIDKKGLNKGFIPFSFMHI